MRALRILSRNIRDSFKGVFRNFSLSLASISCITITLIVVALAIVLSYNVNNFAINVETNVEIVAFMPSDITAVEKDIVYEKIKKIEGIKEIKYQSKKDIAEEMASTSPELEEIMKRWTEEENPLQPSYRIKVVDINNIGSIAKKIESIENVGPVRYGEEMVEQLILTFETVKKISIGMVIALVIVTGFLISNTIKITIVSRRKEIEIMRLVGASNINIKIPFIFEGLVLGILGAIIPIIITMYGYSSFYKSFKGNSLSPFIELIKPNPFMYYISLVLVAIGIAVGMFGSSSAVRKHLKI